MRLIQLNSGLNILIFQSFINRLQILRSNKIEASVQDFNPQEEKILKQLDGGVNILKKLATGEDNFSKSDAFDGYQVLLDCKSKTDKFLQNSTLFSISLKDKLQTLNLNLGYGIKKLNDIINHKKYQVQSPPKIILDENFDFIEKTSPPKISNPFDEMFSNQQTIELPKQNEVRPVSIPFKNPFDEEEFEITSKVKEPANIIYQKKQDHKKNNTKLFIPMSTLESKGVKSNINQKQEKDLLELNVKPKMIEKDFFLDSNDLKTEKQSKSQFDVNLF